jgi:riboflavin biosynthesis pyrimidine reductase
VVTTGNLPGEAPVITEAQVPTLVLTCTTAPQAARQAWAEAGAEVILAGEYAVDLAVAVQKLIDRGLCRINCEGGPHLFGALLTAGLVNELRLTLSPLLTAGEAGRIAASQVPLDAPAKLQLSSVLGAEDTLMLRYLVDHDIRH